MLSIFTIYFHGFSERRFLNLHHFLHAGDRDIDKTMKIREEKNWNKKEKMARRLTEVIKNIPEGLKPFVNDYEAHVVEVAWMTDEELERLSSDFRIVADFFVQKIFRD